MRGHEVRHGILSLSLLPIQLTVALFKAFVQLVRRLVHIVQHPLGNMLRRDLELSADVMLDKLAQERLVFVIQDIIISNARTHKNLLHIRQAAKFPEQLHIVAV